MKRPGRRIERCRIQIKSQEILGELCALRDEGSCGRRAEAHAHGDPSDAGHLYAHGLRQSDWLFEIKWDGYRAVAFIEEGHVRLVSRTQKILPRSLSSLAACRNS